MEQFKTLEDIRESLKQLSKWFSRPIVKGEHPMLFLNPESTNGDVINGIQRDGYVFSTGGYWILPSRTHGLSFFSF